MAQIWMYSVASKVNNNDDMTTFIPLSLNKSGYGTTTFPVRLF